MMGWPVGLAAALAVVALAGCVEVGVSAIAIPLWALESPERFTVVEASFATETEPLPPLVVADETCVFICDDCDCPLFDVASPVVAATAGWLLVGAAVTEGMGSGLGTALVLGLPLVAWVLLCWVLVLDPLLVV